MELGEQQATAREQAAQEATSNTTAEASDAIETTKALAEEVAALTAAATEKEGDALHRPHPGGAVRRGSLSQDAAAVGAALAFKRLFAFNQGFTSRPPPPGCADQGWGRAPISRSF